MELDRARPVQDFLREVSLSAPSLIIASLLVVWGMVTFFTQMLFFPEPLTMCWNLAPMVLGWFLAPKEKKVGVATLFFSLGILFNIYMYVDNFRIGLYAPTRADGQSFLMFLVLPIMGFPLILGVGGACRLFFLKPGPGEAPPHVLVRLLWLILMVIGLGGGAFLLTISH